MSVKTLKFGVCLLFSVLIISIFVLSCDNKGIGPNGGNGSGPFTITITNPEEGDTIISSIIIEAEADSLPQYMEFDFDTFATIKDSGEAEVFMAWYDVCLYPSGYYTFSVSAYWEDTTTTAEITVFIQYVECDPTQPVELNGDTIPESKVTRNAAGCVRALTLQSMGWTDPNCINGVEEYSATLVRLSLSGNHLSSIDLNPLSSCRNLWMLSLCVNQISGIDLTPLSNVQNMGFLGLCFNQLTSIELAPLSECRNFQELYLSFNSLSHIDLTPLWDLKAFRYFSIDFNDLGSTSCNHVCNFIDSHPDCDVWTDCDCYGKSMIQVNERMSNREKRLMRIMEQFHDLSDRVD
ncbi:hypothetical protein JXI42_13195 [bacterium]|nr:hypothetical protein [bacterium]